MRKISFLKLEFMFRKKGNIALNEKSAKHTTHEWVQGISPETNKTMQTWLYTNSVMAVVSISKDKFGVIRLFEKYPPEPEQIFGTLKEAMTYVEMYIKNPKHYSRKPN